MLRPRWSTRFLIAALAALAPVSSVAVAANAAVPPGAGPVITVPPGIAADCSVDVTTALNDWVAGAPDGATLQFGENACYLVEGTLVVKDRHGLTFDGNGATLQATTVKRSSKRRQGD